jgi:hypothetical protein
VTLNPRMPEFLSQQTHKHDGKKNTAMRGREGGGRSKQSNSFACYWRGRLWAAAAAAAVRRRRLLQCGSGDGGAAREPWAAACA